MTTNQTDRYRNRTAEVEAVQWTGDNATALRAFCGPDFDEIAPEDRTEDPEETAAVRTHPHGGWLGLKPGDWVLKQSGHFTMASNEEFADLYEPSDGIQRCPQHPDAYGYEHPSCGFHWHGRDGMDVPLRDGEPVCPRCELRRMAVEPQPDDTIHRCPGRWGGPDCRCFDTAAAAGQVADDTQDETREWCKCPSCWGWFVEDHPGEDLDELGRDLGWWSGLPEHRDAPAVGGARQQHAPGKAVLCRDCRDKGHTICMTDEARQACACGQPGCEYCDEEDDRD